MAVVLAHAILANEASPGPTLLCLDDLVATDPTAGLLSTRVSSASDRLESSPLVTPEYGASCTASCGDDSCYTIPGSPVGSTGTFDFQTINGNGHSHCNTVES